MTEPLVSVLVCCYNRRDYLSQTVDSILDQDYSNIEIVVIDDGSTDGTEQMLSERFGDRLRYFRQENQGVTVARNRAASEARGELIAFQDDDDLMPARRITALLAALETYPEAAFATGDLAYIDSEGQPLNRRWMPGPLGLREDARLLPDGQTAILWPHVPAVPHTTLFRRRDGDLAGWFDTSFTHAAEDADFLARLGQDKPIAYTREVVSLYRLGHAALTRKLIRTETARVQLWEKHLALIGTRKPALVDRLHERVLSALVRLENCRQTGVVEPGYELDSIIRQSLSQLPLNLRARFKYQARLKMPLKRVLRRGQARPSGS